MDVIKHMLVYEDILKCMIKKDEHPNHSLLIDYLADRIFYPTMSLDKNRENDAKHLRNKTCEHNNITSFICNDVTWLEVLIALAERCEYALAEYGQNNTDKWFWLIIDNMFSFNVSNTNFDYFKVSYVLSDIEEHEKSLIFDRDDLASEEIWAQAMAILNNYIAQKSLK